MDYSQNPQFKYKNASTEDLQASFEGSSGMDLGFFFEQWIYDEYWPFYYFNFGQNTNNELYFVIHQAQQELYGYRPVYEMPVQVRINYSGGGDTTIMVWNDQQTQTYYVSLDEEVSSILIDPDKWILRKVLFDPDIPVAVEESTQGNGVTVYPNPFTSALSIETAWITDGPINILIRDLSGRVITNLYAGIPQPGMSFTWNSADPSFELAGKGVYILEINSPAGSRYMKIIKN
jgi:hypothetical protein